MKAYELLDTPEKWTRETSARNAHHDPAPANSERAVMWCMIGAIWRCYREEYDAVNAESRLRSVLERAIPSITDANDDLATTFADIQRWLRAADV